MDIRRGDIWYIEDRFNSIVGSEQKPGRPAIIVSNERNNEFSPTVEVVYLTTQPKTDLPTHTLIRSTGRDSTAICEQITTVSTERIGNYKGHITDEEMEAVENAMLISLDLQMTEYFDETPPITDETLKLRVAQAEAKCDLLQNMYDALLDKFRNNRK